jgi:hypothetical protein
VKTSNLTGHAKLGAAAATADGGNSSCEDCGFKIDDVTKPAKPHPEMPRRSTPSEGT